MRTRYSGGGVAAVATALIMVVAAHAAVGVTTPECFGKAATIVGSPGERRIDGTSGSDVIVSRQYRQEIYGHGGDDLLCGESSIYGGSGDDRIIVRNPGASYLDSSLLAGGPDDDVIHRAESLTDDPHFQLLTMGGRGDDRIHGGRNPDYLVGGPGRDRLFGQGLWDALQGGPGSDVLVGGRDEDVLKGRAGNDRLAGEGRSDLIRAGSGNDVARGGSGDDRIGGGEGWDVAHGGPDDDVCLNAEEARCELP